MSFFEKIRQRQELKWMLSVPFLYVASWAICADEIRFMISAETVNASVIGREVWVNENRNDRKYVTLLYEFQDDSTGEIRTNSTVKPLGLIDEHDSPEIEVQYLPGVEGASRPVSWLRSYSAIIFVIVNIFAGLLLWWGYSMFKADTWASNPGKRVR